MITLVHVESDNQRELASVLISEYLQWINNSAEREYGLTFDVDAMLTSDIKDHEKFQPPFRTLLLSTRQKSNGRCRLLKATSR
jgi:hypothetical protein